MIGLRLSTVGLCWVQRCTAARFQLLLVGGLRVSMSGVSGFGDL